MKKMCCFTLMALAWPVASGRAAEERTGKARQPLAIVPLFNGCSIYFRNPRRDTLTVMFRRKDGEWQKAFQPVYVEEGGMYRGSIVNLQEDTPYELTITGRGDEILARGEFRTWSSEVPVARTIVLDEENFKGGLTVEESGSPKGWTRYTAEEGFVLRNDRERPLIELYRKKYIILDGLTLCGGDKNAIIVRECEQVRILNCDISGWGRIGIQRFDLDGKYYTEAGRAINWDTGILISRSLGTVVERCYVHDPVGRANPWYYSHPAGPQAVGIDKPMSTVIRYNDFIGSDEHRWNDAGEGAGNFHVDGGFNRDADIYGNLMCFANDDAIEIDGGQTNVRVFLNKFEGCLCGVSIQGCMSGPSYVFRNLLVNMGDEDGVAGQTIKTSSYANGKDAVSFIFNNTCFGTSRDLSLRENLRIVARNNVFAGKRAIGGRKGSPQSECDYNLLSTGAEDDEAHGIVARPEFVDARAALFEPLPASPAVGRGVEIDNFIPAVGGRVDLGAVPLGSDMVLPVRPIPVFLDRYQLNFDPADRGRGAARTVTAATGGEGFSGRYNVRKNDVFDWFEVEPERGVLRSGNRVPFSVRLVPDRMKKRPVLRGAFLIRLENGWSRPVMVYAQTGLLPPIKPAREGASTVYVEAEAPAAGRAWEAVADAGASGGACILAAGEWAKDPAEYAFSVPNAGKYFVLMRIRSDEPVGRHDSVCFSVDGGSLEECHLRSSASWVWSLAPQGKRSRRLQAFDLGEGEHLLRLAPREPTYVDLIAITDQPGPFDP